MDQLDLCAHSYTILALGIRFYIPIDTLSLALLCDSTLTARPRYDLIA